MLITRLATVPSKVRVMIAMPARPTTDALSLKSPLTATHTINKTIHVDNEVSTMFAISVRHGWKYTCKTWKTKNTKVIATTCTAAVLMTTGTKQSNMLLVAPSELP